MRHRKWIFWGRKSFPPTIVSGYGDAVSGYLEKVLRGVLWSCGGWCFMGFHLRVLAEGWLESKGGGGGS